MRRDDSGGKDRLDVVGDRIDEAKQAADEVADQQNLTDEERRTAGDWVTALSPGEEGEGMAKEGTESLPG